MYRLLDKVNNFEEIKNLSVEDLVVLARDVRKFLVENVSKTGGHLASNLGVVELTLALFKSFDFNIDDIVWDVGHQSYVYKMFTGRRDKFTTLREMDSIAGFPSIFESEFDSFGTGHASTSIAATNGIATAKFLSDDDSFTIAVIGDGALTGGLALEGINNLAKSNSKLIVILNDNNMSIDKNVGVTNYTLSKLRTSKKYLELKGNLADKLDDVPIVGGYILDGLKRTKQAVKGLVIGNSTIDSLGVNYYGPIDGHDINKLVDIFGRVKNIEKPIIIHINTVKGKGYLPAMKDPSKFHGIGKFDIKSGKTSSNGKESYTDVFSRSILDIAKKDDKVVAITAAMTSSTGLMDMKKEFPKRVIDVGIAEEYATTYAAGLASKGYKPVVAIYSTFLQRAYDQILHDVCLQKLPVVFAIDRAGIVGKDGATHQGLFDISMFNSMPGMNIIAPMNAKELEEGVKYLIGLNKTAAIRYPRGYASNYMEDRYEPYDYGKSQVIKQGSKLAIIGVGTMVKECMEVADRFEKDGINATVVNARFIKPLDKELLSKLAEDHEYVFTVEEGILNGSYGMNVQRFIGDKVKVGSIGIDDEFVVHGDQEEIKKKYGLDSATLYKKIKNRIDEN